VTTAEIWLNSSFFPSRGSQESYYLLLTVDQIQISSPFVSK